MDLNFTPEQPAFCDRAVDMAIELAFGGTDAALPRFIRLEPARVAA